MKAIILISFLLSFPLDQSICQHMVLNVNDTPSIITEKKAAKDKYIISNKSTMETLRVIDDDGTQLGLQPRWEVENQSFETEPAGSGFIYIRHSATGRYLEISDESPFSGTTLLLTNKKKGPTQQFKQIPCGDGYFNLVSRMNLHLAVEVPTGPDKFGRPLFLNIRKTSMTQAFKFTYPNP